MLIHAPPGYSTLREKISQALTGGGTNYSERQPLLIGIDGRDGPGKSSLASWLAWQFGLPAIHLDTLLDATAERLRWRTEDVRRMINSRLQHQKPKPVIVEGICLLKVLEAIGKAPDYLVFVIKHCNDGAHYLGEEEINPYLATWHPQERAQYTLTWAAPK